MSTRSAHRIIFVSMVLTLAVGSGVKVLKNNQWPSVRFLMGIAVTYLGLSALAEWEPQVASPLAGAIVATTLLSDSNGILEWFNTGELSPSPPAQASKKQLPPPRKTVATTHSQKSSSQPPVARVPGLPPFPVPQV